MDYRETRQQLAEMMAIDYSLKYAEPHYASIIPRIIIERLIESSTGDTIVMPLTPKFTLGEGDDRTIVFTDSLTA